MDSGAPVVNPDAGADRDTEDDLFDLGDSDENDSGEVAQREANKNPSEKTPDDQRTIGLAAENEAEDNLSDSGENDSVGITQGESTSDPNEKTRADTRQAMEAAADNGAEGEEEDPG